MQYNILRIFKNGYYILLLPLVLYPATQNVLLSATATLKMFPINYFHWYSYKCDYKFADREYNQLKQFVRFTDTGYLASILAVLSPSYLPNAFNIHFAITFGYWIAIIALGLDDVDNTNGAEYDVSFEKLWGGLVHAVPITIITYKIMYEPAENSDMCPYCFSPRDLIASYVWLWTWFLAVYIPWRQRTGDPVYSFMDRKSHLGFKMAGGILMHGLLAVSNITGRYIHEYASH
jgi:hypothetical protein